MNTYALVKPQTSFIPCGSVLLSIAMCLRAVSQSDAVRKMQACVFHHSTNSRFVVKMYFDDDTGVFEELFLKELDQRSATAIQLECGLSTRPTFNIQLSRSHIPVLGTLEQFGEKSLYVSFS